MVLTTTNLNKTIVPYSMEKTLQEFGFSPSESKVYLCLLENGASYPNKISAATGINRTNVYGAVERLAKKGVISYVVKNKVKWYEAKSLDVIEALIREKTYALNDARKSISTYKSKLKGIRKRPLEATIFTGKKGLRILFEEMLDKRKPIYVIASKLQIKEIFGPYHKLWHKERIKRKIMQYTILPEKYEKLIPEREYHKCKFINPKFTSPTATWLYGDICLLIQWKKEPVAVRLQDKEIVQSHKNYFSMLWKAAKE